MVTKVSPISLNTSPNCFNDPLVKYQMLGMGNLLVDIFIKSSMQNLQLENLEKGSYASVSLTQAEALLQKAFSADPSSVSANPPSFQCGGAVANTIFYLRERNLSVGLIGSLGGDDKGMFFLSQAKDKNLKLFLNDDLHADQSSPAKTGFCLLWITPDGDRTMRTFLGVAPDLFDPPDYPIDCEDFLLESFLWEKQNNIPISLRWIQKLLANPSPPHINFCAGSVPVFSQHKKQIFLWAEQRFLHRIFLNKEEAFCLTDTDSIPKASTLLAKVFSLAVITDGKNGSWIAKSDSLQHIPSVGGDLKNSTGAGDIYAGEFIRNLQLGETHSDCGLKAARAVYQVLGVDRQC